jgi:hypothetical protein
MAKKSYVEVTGMDNLLLTIEGRFNQSLDERILNATGDFAREMDRAAQKVFRAMAVGAETQGFRASPVIGTNMKTPSFLQSHIPQGQEWKPLNKKYLRRKKSLVKQGRLKTANMWEYSGSLKNILKQRSTEFTRMSGNTFGYRSTINPQTGFHESKKISSRKKDDILFRAIPAIGQNLGGNSLGYDFFYAGITPTVTYTDKHPRKASGTVMDNRYLANMKRSVSFNVFNGFAKYVQDNLDGLRPSPEDFIGEIVGGRAQYTLPGRKRVEVTRSGQTIYVRDLKLKNKLYYFSKGKRQQRALIQPYMRYYFNKVMVPLARKLIGKV